MKITKFTLAVFISFMLSIIQAVFFPHLPITLHKPDYLMTNQDWQMIHIFYYVIPRFFPFIGVFGIAYSKEIFSYVTRIVKRDIERWELSKETLLLICFTILAIACLVMYLLFIFGETRFA